MKPMFNPEELDLVTEQESKFHQTYVEKLIGYSEGKVDGIQIKNLTAGAAVIAKKQQSRSAMALLKYNVIKSGDVTKMRKQLAAA